MASKQNALSPLEHEVMQVIWSRGASTVEDVRQALEDSRPLKESTVRTLLRRIEEKRFITHKIEGRTYIYQPVIAPQKAAARAVQQIVERFCGGSVEALLVGMVNDRLLGRKELQTLADKVAAQTEDQDHV